MEIRRKLTILVVWFLTLGVQAQTKATITGKIVDDEHQPVELASVYIEGTTIGVLADIGGKYKLQVESKDSVVVVCSMMGYKTQKKTLRRPKGAVTLNFHLPTNYQEVGEVTVKEVQRRMDGMERLDPAKTKNTPSVSGNAIEEMIQMQAGVSTHNELSSQYNVRGGSFDENSVYINGVEVYRPLLIRSGQQEGLSVINSDMVKDVSFSAGGYGAQYSDKMSSVLDITYKRLQPGETEGTVSASFLGASAYVGVGKKKFSWLNGVRYKSNRFLLGSLETNGEYDPSYLDYQTYFSWTPNKRWTIDFIGNISQNKYNFTPENRETNFGTMNDVKSFKVYFDGQEKDLFRTFFGSLQIKRQIEANTQFTLLGSLFHTKEQETFDIQGQYWLDDTNTQDNLGIGTYLQHARNYLTAKTATIKGVFDKKIKSHTLKAGLGWKFEKIDDNTREWEMRDSAGYNMPRDPEKLQLIYNLRSINKVNSSRMELFAEDTYRMQTQAGVVRLRYGARLSHWSWNKEWLLSPRLSVGWIPAANENFTFRFATGIYYQTPFYKEIKDTVTVDGNTTVQLNKDIKSQRSIHFVLGGDYKFRMADRVFKLTGELYYKHLSNLIPYNVDNMRIVYYGENISTGYVTGLDMKLYGEFVPGTDSWLSFSLMKAQQKINGKSVPQPTDQRFNVSLYFTDFFPGTERWKMTLKLAYADGLPFGAPHKGLEEHAFRASAYKRVDIGMSYRLLDNERHEYAQGWKSHLKNIWLGVDCLNLLGTNNVSSYYWITDVENQQYAVPNYLTGRQLNAKITVEF
jgi:hypothetical protein